MQEIICPDCQYRNPDIRALGYSLPATCGRCRHIWRLQDFPIEAPKTKEEAFGLLLSAGIITEAGELSPRYGGPKANRKEE